MLEFYTARGLYCNRSFVVGVSKMVDSPFGDQDPILYKIFSVDLRWILLRQKFCKESSSQKFWSSKIQRNSTLKHFYMIGSRARTFFEGTGFEPRTSRYKADCLSFDHHHGLTGKENWEETKLRDSCLMTKRVEDKNDWMKKSKIVGNRIHV